ncbi:MAG: hypothetical protein JWN95_1799 [Frankiales bacterium]|nr:hypothetical protein [Frankiales bacterium]
MSGSRADQAQSGSPSDRPRFKLSRLLWSQERLARESGKYSEQSIQKWRRAEAKHVGPLALLAAVAWFGIFRHGLVSNIGLAVLFVAWLFLTIRWVVAEVDAWRGLRASRKAHDAGQTADLGRSTESSPLGISPASVEPNLKRSHPNVKLVLFASGRRRRLKDKR